MPEIPKRIQRAKSLRTTQTKSEGLLWSLLRSKQLCRMKFRRQHPVGPFYADFACESKKLVIELDGDYHDHIQQTWNANNSLQHKGGRSSGSQTKT